MAHHLFFLQASVFPFFSNYFGVYQEGSPDSETSRAVVCPPQKEHQAWPCCSERSAGHRFPWMVETLNKAAQTSSGFIGDHRIHRGKMNSPSGACNWRHKCGGASAGKFPAPSSLKTANKK